MKIDSKAFYLLFVVWINPLPNCFSQISRLDTVPIPNIKKNININGKKSDPVIWTPYKSEFSEGYKIEGVNLDSGHKPSSFYRLFTKTREIKSKLLKQENQNKYDFRIFNSNVNLGNSFLFEQYYTRLFANSIFLLNNYFTSGIDIDNFQCNNFNIRGCYVPYLEIVNSGGYFDISDVIVNDNVNINSFSGKVIMNRISAKSDSLRVNIIDSKIQMEISKDSEDKEMSLFFRTDTLEKGFNIRLFDSVLQGVISFENCLINCNISFLGMNRNVQCSFTNCKFGPNARIDNFTGESIGFFNCTNFENQLDITTSYLIDEDNPVSLTFYNTDLTKINFSYLGSVKLKLYSERIEEVDISNYETLLNKYQNEGKASSYKKLMIEYEMYQYSKYRFWGKIGNLLDRMWWNYGFDKKRIFLWTFISLVLFFIGNLSAKNSINKLYPIYGEQRIFYDTMQIKKFNFYRSKVWRILLITMIIFFTFKLDVNALFKLKLNFISWVLLQYVFGLWCLFWIFNYVLKA